MWWIHAVAILATVGVVACTNPNSEQKLPPDVQDPAVLRNPQGALARYRGALSHLPGTLDRLILVSGLLTDELMAQPMRPGMTSSYSGLDSRMDLTSSALPTATRLYRLRGQVQEARGFVEAYLDSLPDLAGHLYAVEAYTEIFLADFFCSGIPLSTVNYDGTHTFASGSTTSEVYRHAIGLLDSAVGLLGDSTRLLHLAAMGRGRAHLALGEYTAAAEAVANVPDDYAYRVRFLGLVALNLGGGSSTTPDSAVIWWASYGWAPTSALGLPGVANRDGGVGLDYRTSGDPRSTFDSTTIHSDELGNRRYFPLKYRNTSNPASINVEFVLASGIEARLIEAEAALRGGASDGRWLQILNHLRATSWPTIVPAVAGPLPDLLDPGTDEAGTDAPRVDLLFRERAMWLFLTAQRQGDLRRLIRNYQRPRESVYPTGTYPGGTGFFGDEIVSPMPATEVELNPRYTGCFHREA